MIKYSMTWAIFAYQFIVARRILKFYSENMHSVFHLNIIVDAHIKFQIIILKVDVFVKIRVSAYDFPHVDIVIQNANKMKHSPNMFTK